MKIDIDYEGSPLNKEQLKDAVSKYLGEFTVKIYKLGIEESENSELNLDSESSHELICDASLSVTEAPTENYITGFWFEMLSLN